MESLRKWRLKMTTNGVQVMSVQGKFFPGRKCESGTPGQIFIKRSLTVTP